MAEPEQESEEDYMDDVPLHHQRAFGSGLGRKKVVFVPASSGPLSTTDQATAAKPSQRIGDRYLGLVLSKNGSSQDVHSADPKTPSEPAQDPPAVLCEVCGLPLTPVPEAADEDVEAASSRYPRDQHAASLVHQVCLAHSHPPSALDRSRMGMAYLQSRGWDPDAREGLGSAHQGIMYPLKAKPKDDTLGIGVVVPKNVAGVKKREKAQPMGARKMRRVAQEDKKRTERLRQQLFSSLDLERYLGPGAGG